MCRATEAIRSVLEAKGITFTADEAYDLLEVIVAAQEDDARSERLADDWYGPRHFAALKKDSDSET